MSGGSAEGYTSKAWNLKCAVWKFGGYMATLGGLFKLCLTENKGAAHELRRLLREIDMRQMELKEIISKIR